MYGQKVLGMDLAMTRYLKEALFEGNEVLRVGFTRVNFSFFLNAEDINYLLDAIEFVARYGWMFLPHYKFDQDSGLWVNRAE